MTGERSRAIVATRARAALVRIIDGGVMSRGDAENIHAYTFDLSAALSVASKNLAAVEADREKLIAQVTSEELGRLEATTRAGRLEHEASLQRTHIEWMRDHINKLSARLETQERRRKQSRKRASDKQKTGLV